MKIEMKQRQTAILVMIFLGLCLTSAAFFACYFLAQDSFAVPTQIEKFIQEYRDQQPTVQQPEITPVAKPQEAMLLDLCYVSGEEAAAVISVLDGRKGKLYLYTMPEDTRIEFSEAQYQQLAAKYPSVPQICWLGVLENYMASSEVAQVLAWIFGENFRCDFTTYRTVPREDVAQWYNFDGDFVQFCDNISNFFRLSSSSKKVLERIYSLGLPVDFFYYAETLALLTPSDITEEMAAGKKGNGGYVLDIDRVRLQLAGK